MLARIKERARTFVYTREGTEFCRYFNLANKYYWRDPITAEWDAEQGRVVLRDTGGSAAFPSPVYIARMGRVHNFANGIRARLNLLAEQYFLDRVPLNDGDVVIDCGANIGEIGLYYQHTGVAIRYFGFEPENVEADCNELNNANAQSTIIRKALWHEETTLTFYSKSDSADSSAFEVDDYTTKTEIPATTVAAFMQAENLDRIALLKLEAEGAEPEILEGVGDRLADIHYISADCGRERGMARDHTVSQVSNALIGNGFEMVDMSFDRIVCLYRNKRFG